MLDKEPPWIRSFHRGVDRIPFGRNGGGRGQRQRYMCQRRERGHQTPNPPKGLTTAVT